MPVDIEKIRVLCTRLKLSQTAASKMAGLTTHRHRSLIETGAKCNLKIDTLERIAGALGVKAKDLLK